MGSSTAARLENVVASRELVAITLRLDFLRDIVVELAAAQPADRAEQVLSVVANRWMQRISDLALDEATDEAVAADLAPILAALHHSCGHPQTDLSQAGP